MSIDDGNHLPSCDPSSIHNNIINSKLILSATLLRLNRSTDSNKIAHGNTLILKKIHRLLPTDNRQARGQTSMTQTNNNPYCPTSGLGSSLLLVRYLNLITNEFWKIILFRIHLIILGYSLILYKTENVIGKIILTHHLIDSLLQNKSLVSLTSFVFKRKREMVILVNRSR